MSSISLRVISRVCGSIAATRWGVKACCMRARTRVCFGGSSRSSVSIFVSSSAPGTGWERAKAAENVLKSRRIASQSAHRRNPSAPSGSTRQSGPLARSSANSRLPSTVKLGSRRSRTGSASKPAGTGLFALAATFCSPCDMDRLLATWIVSLRHGSCFLWHLLPVIPRYLTFRCRRRGQDSATRRL